MELQGVRRWRGREGGCGHVVSVVTVMLFVFARAPCARAARRVSADIGLLSGGGLRGGGRDALPAEMLKAEVSHAW